MTYGTPRSTRRRATRQAWPKELQPVALADVGGLLVHVEDLARLAQDQVVRPGLRPLRRSHEGVPGTRPREDVEGIHEGAPPPLLLVGEPLGDQALHGEGVPRGVAARDERLEGWSQEALLGEAPLGFRQDHVRRNLARVPGTVSLEVARRSPRAEGNTAPEPGALPVCMR